MTSASQALTTIKTHALSPVAVLIYLLLILVALIASILIVICLYKCINNLEDVRRLAHHQRNLRLAQLVRRGNAAAHQGYTRPRALGRLKVFHKNIFYWLHSRFYSRRGRRYARSWYGQGHGQRQTERDLESASVTFRSVVDRQREEQIQKEERERRTKRLEELLGRPLEGEEQRCVAWDMRLKLRDRTVTVLEEIQESEGVEDAIEEVEDEAVGDDDGQVAKEVLEVRATRHSEGNRCISAENR